MTVMSDPYMTTGNPDHPGVKGEPYSSRPMGGMVKVDCPGTGTFPSHQQGVINKSQPQGLSSTNQYGQPSVVVSDEHKEAMANLANPANYPVTPKENNYLNIQPSIPGVNVAIEIAPETSNTIEEDHDGTASY